MSLLAVPEERDGVDKVKTNGEASLPYLIIPKDLDSQEAMVAFFSVTLAHATEGKGRSGCMGS
jgi:hypothetical protein